MGLLSRSKIFDPIRKIWVAATPEEKVRQGVVQYMLEHLGYPKELLSIEKDLKTLPHLGALEKNFPPRRIDIICFAKDICPGYALYPLLMIECKQKKLDVNSIEQILGYNYYIKAFFIAVANDCEIRLGYLEKETNQYRFTSHLPSFHELLEQVTPSARIREPSDGAGSSHF